MNKEPKSGRWAPGSVATLLLLIAAIVVVGFLIGAALTAIGPSQDPNTSLHRPATALAATA